MKTRIPLQIIDGRLVLMGLIECSALRIPKQIMEFVIDTGSPDSYISNSDVGRLQIPLRIRAADGEVDFGGSRFKHVKLPNINMYLLDENKKHLIFKVSLSALKTTKTSEKKVQVASSLPSILGMDFLKDQKLSLHVVISEDLSYLETS